MEHEIKNFVNTGQNAKSARSQSHMAPREARISDIQYQLHCNRTPRRVDTLHGIIVADDSIAIAGNKECATIASVFSYVELLVANGTD